MGAGLPANTGEARAIHHGVGFAGKPASTRLTLRSGFKLYFQ
ncbi:nucleoside hydrolase, partial [Pseudomonas putida]